jgi:hypothetical protein
VGVVALWGERAERLSNRGFVTLGGRGDPGHSSHFDRFDSWKFRQPRTGRFRPVKRVECKQNWRRDLDLCICIYTYTAQRCDEVDDIGGHWRAGGPNVRDRRPL